MSADTAGAQADEAQAAAPEIAPAEYPSLAEGVRRPEPSSLDRIASVQLEVSVELGRTRLPVREVLSFDEGTVVELGRNVDAPVDVFANGTLIAYGEVVVVGDELGVRITQVVGSSHS